MVRDGAARFEYPNALSALNALPVSKQSKQKLSTGKKHNIGDTTCTSNYGSKQGNKIHQHRY